MPFTFSHPAVIIPLNSFFRRYVSLAGLIIGAVIPDFEYFLRLKSKYSHTIDGLFWFDLPLGVFLGYIFFNITMPALVDNLPAAVQSRLTDLRTFNWNTHFRGNWLKVCLSILIGSATHLLWDSFTHYFGYFVQIFPTLKSNIALFGKKIPVYRTLQHISTLTGGTVVVYYIWKLPIKKAGPAINPVYWLIVTITAAVIISAYIIITDYHILWSTVIVTIAAFLAALTAAPLIMQTGRRGRHNL